jgi:hypothetical protein
MITEESSAVMIAHAANMTMQRQREAAKKKQPQAPHRPSSAKKATLPPLSNIAKAGMLRELRYCAAFKYFEELYIKKGMKKETQEEFMYANYHGDNMCRGFHQARQCQGYRQNYQGLRRKSSSSQL